MSSETKCNQDDRNVQTCSFASQAANEAVEKTFAILGVNVHEPKEVEEFRKSLRFGDSMRKAADKGVLALVVVLVGMGTAVFFARFGIKG